MTSAQHPNRVYFSSLDRSPVDSNTDFTITFDTPIERARNFEVVTASFPNTFHQFAPYETILYFYHESFQGGAVAIAIPMSITLFAEGGATGEANIPSLRPAGRQEYIDGRYFLDGEDLQDYLNNWIQSLSTSWPTQASGLRPFYHPNDDPTQPIIYIASEAASGITFTNLAFDFDTTTSAGGRGSLKFTFSDSSAEIVRIASVVDYGVLRQDWLYPSQLGYKMGFTTLEPQAFDAVVNITSANNQIQVNLLTHYVNITNANNTFRLKYTDDADTAHDELITLDTSTGSVVSIQDYITGSIYLGVQNANLPNVLLAGVPTTTGTGGNTPTTISFRFVNCKVGSTAYANFSTNSTMYNTISVATGDISLGTITSANTILAYTTGNVVTNSDDKEPNLFSIPQTDYTPTALANELNDLIRTVPLSGELSASTSSLQMVFTLEFNNNPYARYKGWEIAFDAGSSVQQACKTALGFVDNSNVLLYTWNTNVSITAPNNVNTEGLPADEEDVAEDPINLIRTSNIYFASSLSGGEALSSAGRKDILFSVPLTAPVGSVQLYQSTLSGIVINRPPDVVRNLRVTLLDDNFQTIEPLPQNASISVEIHFAYVDENQTNNVSTIIRY